jgi:hypothetical protein
MRCHPLPDARRPVEARVHGAEGGGPWIVPCLDVWLGRRKSVSDQARRLLEACEKDQLDSARYAVAADRLEEEALAEWASAVRLAGRRAEVFRQWCDNEDDRWDYREDGTGSGDVFDDLPWRFAPRLAAALPRGAPAGQRHALRRPRWRGAWARWGLWKRALWLLHHLQSERASPLAWQAALVLV